MPGEYRVTLTVNGRDAATKTVRVLGDPIMSITDADRRTWHDTALNLHELQRSANDAAEVVAQVGEQFSSVQGMLRVASNAPAGAKTATEEMAKRVNALRRQLGVPIPGQRGGGGGGGGGGRDQDVRGRISTLKSQIMASTSLPTEIQMTTSRLVRDDLAKVIDEANAVISTHMPAYYRTVNAGTYLPNPIKGIRTTTVTSSQ
jgi:hypothetical protein